MADINELMDDKDEDAITEIEGDTEYAHDVIDQEKFIDPNDGDAPEKEAESIESEPAIEELAKEPFEGEEALASEEPPV